MHLEPIVLSLCDHSGVMVQPWLDAGHECWIVDSKHPHGEHRDGNLVRVGTDILKWLPPRRDYAIAFAFPPCTDLANSGARWFKDKGVDALAEALPVVVRCRTICEWTESPWLVENPVGQLSTYWRKPDFACDPCDYGGYLNPPGDHYTKRTCLWLGNRFKLPWKRPVPAREGSKMHLLPPSDDRAAIRSLTPAGFAQAVFEANATHTLMEGD